MERRPRVLQSFRIKSWRRHGLINYFKDVRQQGHITPTEAAFLKHYGYYAHYIVPKNRANVNYHTHGLPENKWHLDLQIVCPVKPDLAHKIFWSVVCEINSGHMFRDGEKSDAIADRPMEFREFAEGGRRVLRIIIPDDDGRFPSDAGCEEPYKWQYEPTFVETSKS